MFEISPIGSASDDDLRQAFDHGGNGRVGQGQAVEHGRRQAGGSRRVEVALIGRAQQIGIAHDGGGDQAQGAVARGAVGTRHGARSGARAHAHVLHIFCDVHARIHSVKN